MIWARGGVGWHPDAEAIPKATMRAWGQSKAGELIQVILPCRPLLRDARAGSNHLFVFFAAILYLYQGQAGRPDEANN